MMSVMQQVLSFVSGAADKTAEIHGKLSLFCASTIYDQQLHILESPSKDSGTSLPFQIPQEVPPPHGLCL
jgi:hypothetical protein